MYELLNDLFVVSFEAAKGSAKDCPVNGVYGRVRPLIFVLEVNSVLLSRVRVSHILGYVAGDYFVVNMECCSAYWGIECGLEVQKLRWRQPHER